MQIIGNVDVAGYEANVENFDFHINQYKNNYKKIHEEYESSVFWKREEREYRYKQYKYSIWDVNQDIDSLIHQLNNQIPKLSKVNDELKDALQLFDKVEISNQIHDEGEKNFESLKNSVEKLRKLCSSYVDKLPKAKMK